MIKTICISASIVMCIVSTAFADVNGAYVWKHGKARKELEVKQISPNRIKFSLTMGEGVIGGCGGMIDPSNAELNGNVATFTGEGDFLLRMVFKKNTVEVSEEGNGSMYHGPSCEFSAIYNRNIIQKTK